MNAISYIIPLAIILIVIYAFLKKINVYEAFANGIKSAYKLIIDIFPFICAIMIMSELMARSGLTQAITHILTPPLKLFGIPPEIIPLVIIKPFSGSGSLAFLNDIYLTYGVDSYVSRCASAIFGSSETIFYVAVVYFSKCKHKNLAKPITISLFSSFISCVFACLICKFL